MRAEAEVIGLRGDVSFEDLLGHFTSEGMDAVIMDPMQVYGKEMVLSAVIHAQRAFEQGENSSKSILTEVLLYASGERQISKALTKMRPKEGSREYVVAFIGCGVDPHLEEMGLERDDSIIEGNGEKAERMGLTNDLGIPYGDLALERVAMVDILKKSK